jgi:hypothetical protein
MLEDNKSQPLTTSPKEDAANSALEARHLIHRSFEGFSELEPLPKKYRQM